MSKFVETVVAVVLIVYGSLTSWAGGSVLVRIGIAILIDEAAQSLIGSPSTGFQGVNRPGDRIVQNNTLADATLIYGSMDHVGGPPSYWNVSGTNNEFIWYVIPVSMRPVDSFLLLHLDSDTINLSTDLDGSGNVNTGKYNGYVQVKVYVGAISATADPTLVSTFGSEYTSSFKGNSIAYFWVKFKRDTRTDDQISSAVAPQNIRLFQSGPPNEISVSVSGHHVYDPRQDSTNGGSGSCRMNDPTTWIFSSNPALIIRDYLTATGIYKTFYGNNGLNIGCLDWPTSIIDDVAVATSANICDTTFLDTDSVAHAQFALNGLIDVGNTYGDNLQLMLTTMGGSLVPQGSKYQINAAQYVAPSFTVDETWIADNLTIRQLQPTTQGDFYNAVRGNFIDGDQFYQGADFYPFTSAVYEAADNGRYWKDINLSLVTNRYVAQRVAILYGKMTRNQMLVTGTFNLKALNVAIGDTITLTIAGIFSAKVFKVYNWKLSAAGIEMQLREENSTPYSIFTTDLGPVNSPVTPGLVYPIPPAPVLVDIQGVADGINILVTPPPEVLYKFMVVYRNSTNTRTGATYRGRFVGNVFHDHELLGQPWYYWIYAVNDANQLSTALNINATARWGMDSTGSGTNIMPLAYSIFGLNGILPSLDSYHMALAIAGSAHDAYGYPPLRLTSTGVAIFQVGLVPALANTVTVKGLFSNKKYIFSVHVESGSGVAAEYNFSVVADTAAQRTVVYTSSAVAAAPGTTSGQPGVYTCVLDFTGLTLAQAQSIGALYLVWASAPANGNAIYIQGVMVEEQKGNNTNPSNFVPPGIYIFDPAGGTGGTFGSTPTTVPNLTFSYNNSIAGKITWSWATFNILRADTSAQSVPGSSFPTTGLANTTTYKFYPFINEVLLQGGSSSNCISYVGLNAGDPTGAGSTAAAFPSAGSATAAQYMTLLGRCPLSAAGMAAVTSGAGGGGGGGSGGGIGSCLHPNTYIETKNRGWITANDLTLGDLVLTTKGWKPVLKRWNEKGPHAWVKFKIRGCNESVTCTSNEPIYKPDGTAIVASDLKLRVALDGGKDIVLYVNHVEEVNDTAYRVCTDVGGDNTFYLWDGGPRVHNTTQKP